ncbi:hypothetical protein C4573_03240 [Candidatus Woesearchaeota archaeon]|nr:MAG: hypothetical protein C4573_03240 [Candidatus Woesearchaeota archaeon]
MAIIQTIPLMDNPCVIDIMIDFADTQFRQAFGKPRSEISETELYSLLQQRDVHHDSIRVMLNLLSRNKLTSLDKILCIHDMKLEPYYLHEGYGSEALEQLRDLNAMFKSPYEYMLCKPINDLGLELAKRNRFEDVGHGYFGQEL